MSEKRVVDAFNNLRTSNFLEREVDFGWLEWVAYPKTEESLVDIPDGTFNKADIK